MRVPWTARRSDQSILMEINPDYLLEAPIHWPPDVKSQLIGKYLDGEIEEDLTHTAEKEMCRLSREKMLE